jgi:hypothetical protein
VFGSLSRWAGVTLIVWAGVNGHAYANTPAQQGTSTLRVRVTDAQAAHPASVSLSRDDRPESVRVISVSGAIDTAAFTNLEPGVFVLRVDGTDGPLASIRLAIAAREIVAVDVGPESRGSPTLRIRIVARTAIDEGVSFDERWLEDLPSGRDLWSLIETSVPFVIADRMDTGGVGLGHSALLGGRGASWISTGITFGDLRVLAPNALGLVPIAPDLTAVTGVSITSGLAPVEADTPGVLVALTPRRPALTRRGSFHASLTEPGMVDDKALPNAPAIARMSTWREAGGQLSMPISQRTGLLLSAAGARSEFFERNLPVLWRAESASLLGHLVSHIDERNVFRLLGSAQHAKYPFEQRRQFGDRFVSERGRFAQATASWDHMADSAMTSLGLSFQRGSFKPLVYNPAGGTIERVTDGIVPPPATATVSSEWGVTGSMTWPSFTFGRSTHELRAGVNARRAITTSSTVALPTVAEQVAGIAARVWIPAAGASGVDRTRLTGAAYLADRISLGAKLSIELGVRADISRGSSSARSQTVDWRTVSPRGSFHWNLGPVSIFGGGGLYSDPLPLAWLGFGDAGETLSDVYRWNDLDNDRRFDAGEQGVLVTRHGWGQSIASIDSGLRAPRTVERTLGFELGARRALRFRSAIIWREQTSLLASVNTGVPASSYRVLYIPDASTDWDGPDDDRLLPVYERLPESFGKDRYLLTNPEGEQANYDGVEFTWTLNTRRVVALFGVTAYRTRSWSANLGFGPLENDLGIIGERLERANAQPEVQGSYFFDRSYVGKFLAAYRAPGDIRFAVAARYQDGQPFSRVVVAPDLSTGAEMIHAYRTGRTRYTFTLTVDARVAKDFSIGGARGSVHIDVFNLTRSLNEVEEDVLTTPSFRRSTAMQPPLAARVGFRISF